MHQKKVLGWNGKRKVVREPTHKMAVHASKTFTYK